MRPELDRMQRQIAVAEAIGMGDHLHTSDKRSVIALVESQDAELERLRAELEQVKRERDAEIKRALDVALEVRRASEGELARQRDSARAENARLREALTIWSSGDYSRADIWTITKAALAATDSREWLREFGMRVAGIAIRRADPICQPPHAVLAAIVDGVMK